MKKRIAVAIALIAFGILSIIPTSPSDHSLKSRVVKLTSERGVCSGEQVKAPSGVSYVLTAAHCGSLAVDGQITVTTEDGRKLPRRIIAEDDLNDLLLLEGVPGMDGIEVAASTLKSESIRTFTHGRGFKTYKTRGELVEKKRVQIPVDTAVTKEDEKKCSGKAKFKVVDMNLGFWVMRMCVMDVELTVTTATIVPGSSGGMVVNDAGELVGVVSAGDGVFGYLVPVDDINRFISNY